MPHARPRVVDGSAGTLPPGDHRLGADFGHQVALLAEPVDARLQVALLAVAADHLGSDAAARQGSLDDDTEVVGVLARVGQAGLLGEPGFELHLEILPEIHTIAEREPLSVRTFYLK